VNVRVKVDEDLPRQVADILSSCGYDAVTVWGQGWQGASDEVLWRRVQAEGRWLVTADKEFDKEFADLRRHPPGSHAGVILLRPQEESRRAYLELATIAVERLKLKEIAGAVAVVTERGIRIRRSPRS
jgi:predicted nuclease of predicted toxin-antitoxin system